MSQEWLGEKEASYQKDRLCLVVDSQLFEIGSIKPLVLYFKGRLEAACSILNYFSNLENIY